jgi:hypothetical protein
MHPVMQLDQPLQLRDAWQGWHQLDAARRGEQAREQAHGPGSCARTDRRQRGWARRSGWAGSIDPSRFCAEDKAASQQQ